MQSKNLGSLLLVVLPILSLFVIFVCLYLFSNFKVSTNFVYFEENQYSSQNAVTVVNNKLEYGESEVYKMQKQKKEVQKKELENCKLINPSITTDQICESKLGYPQDFDYGNNSTLPKIYLYDAEKEASKLIDLGTAKGLTLVTERQNEAGESFESGNCSGRTGLLFGGYSGSCDDDSKIVIKKNYASKNVELEATINIDKSKYTLGKEYPLGGSQSQRNIYWIKK